jgi:hypothetical protein
MTTFVTIPTGSGEIIRLEEDDGQMYLAYLCDPESDASPVYMDVTVDLLQTLYLSALIRTPIRVPEQHDLAI